MVTLANSKLQHSKKQLMPRKPKVKDVVFM